MKSYKEVHCRKYDLLDELKALDDQFYFPGTVFLNKPIDFLIGNNA